MPDFSRGAIPAVLSQHAEEAAFQWLLRSYAVHAPHYGLRDLARLDDVVEAHLDGLRIAGDAGWDICRAELAWEEPGEVFAAGVLAFGSGNSERITAVTEAAVKTPATATGLASALGWLSYEAARPHLENLGQSADPLLRRIAVAGAAIHREDPGPALVTALQKPDPVVTPRALRAAGELARRDLLPQCQALLTANDPETRFWAAWAAVLLGDRKATGTLIDIAGAGGPRAGHAAALAARALPPARADQWHRELATNIGRRRLAALVAGAAGDPRAVPWLIEMMAEDELARPAGEAFSLVTGLDLAYLDLDRDQPEDFEAGPSEDPADEDVALDPDEDLPWPDPVLIGGWWRRHGRRFKDGVRYLAGAAVDVKQAEVVLRSGTQRLRAAAALELVLQQPGTPLFEVRARGDRQTQALAG